MKFLKYGPRSRRRIRLGRNENRKLPGGKTMKKELEIVKMTIEFKDSASVLIFEYDDRPKLIKRLMRLCDRFHYVFLRLKGGK